MAAIRNSAFARGVLAAAGAHVVFTVPAGYVLLLKNYILANAGSTTANAYIVLTDSTGADQAVVEVVSMPAGSYHTWNGWTAANGGDTLTVTVDQVPFRYWFSGALLPFAPGA